MAAPPAPARQPRYVRVLRVAPPGAAAFVGERFGPVRFDDIDDAGLLAARACAEFGWGPPTRCGLYLVRSEAAALAIRAHPASAADVLRGEPLAESIPLADVPPGSWLLACISGEPAPRRGGADFLSSLLSPPAACAGGHARHDQLGFSTVARLVRDAAAALCVYITVHVLRAEDAGSLCVDGVGASRLPTHCNTECLGFRAGFAGDDSRCRDPGLFRLDFDSGRHSGKAE